MIHSVGRFSAGVLPPLAFNYPRRDNPQASDKTEDKMPLSGQIDPGEINPIKLSKVCSILN
jgi:hypothetical protein